MRIRLSLKYKLLFSILIVTLVIFMLVVGLISYNMRQITIADSKLLTDNFAEKSAKKVEGLLNIDIGVARGLANSFLALTDLPFEERRQYYNPILKSILSEYPSYIGVWDCWEFSAIDPEWGDKPGRISNIYFRENNQIQHNEKVRDVGGITNYTEYHTVRDVKQEYITQPYWCTYSNQENDKILETTLAVPMLQNGRFQGLIGLDVELNRFQDMIKGLQPIKDSYTVLVDNEGRFVAHPNEEMVFKLLKDEMPQITRDNQLEAQIQNGSAFAFIDDYQGRDYYFSFAPIHVGNTPNTWAIGIFVPYDSMIYEANKNFGVSLIISLIGLILMGTVLWFVAVNITRPLIYINQVLKSLDRGEFSNIQALNIKSNDEISEIAKSLNRLTTGLKETTQFANEVGRGNLDSDFNKLSENDELGTALLNMRDSLKTSEEERRKQQQEEKIRNWQSSNIAKFSEILRYNTDDMAEYSYQIISNLVDLVNANQGGLFLLVENNNTDEHHYLELMASYAYNRRKFVDKKILVGEGIVGQCVLEKEPTYLNSIPKNYLTIASGLGQSEPRYLYVQPLIFNEKVYGVVEVAAFDEFLPQYIEFILKISESIASALANIKINIKTSELLEESKEKSEQLTVHEEEMRQNMEELNATQEEMNYKLERAYSEIERLEKLLEEKEKQLNNYKNTEDEAI